MKKLLYMYRYAGKYWPLAILCPIAMAGEAMLELQIPTITGSLITELRAAEATGIMLSATYIWETYGLKMVVISLISLCLGILGGVFAAIAGGGFSYNLKKDLFNKIEAFSFTNIDKYSSSSLITRMTTDTNWVRMGFQMSIRMLFRAPVLFIYAIVLAFRINKEISMIFIYILPILAICLLFIFAFSHPYMEKSIKTLDKLNQDVEENVRGIRAVKSFTREEAEIKKFDETNEKLYKYQNTAYKIINLNSPLMTLGIYAIIVCIVWFGAKTVGLEYGIEDGMKIGDITALLSYATQVLTSLMFVSMIFAMFIISKPSRDRVYEVLHEIPTIKNKENPIKECKDGSFEFEHVKFKYNESSEKYVLDDINLKVNSGETVGILGTTGSSKSTLVAMLARLYDVNSGSVKVGGVDVRDYDLGILRDNVSIVLQKNLLFSGTVADNIRWGKKDASIEEIVEVCKIAQADSFINQMPNGYETMIEQGGTNVSGGQRQRLTIARALIKHPKILIMDDSMSAVDTKTDKLIRDGLKNYSKETTKVIIAQRCQSVIDVDKIIIIDDGKIIASGKHEELIKNSKEYQELYYSQNKEVQNA